MKKKLLEWLGKRVLMRLARLCLHRANSTKHCWICGKHPSMGPIWAGRMTCWECYKEWSPFHNRNLIVDWRGLGRLRQKPLPELSVTDALEKVGAK